MELISSSVVRSLWVCKHVDWFYSVSRGASGGILLMWDSRVVEKVEERIGEFIVACSFRNVEDGFSWAFAVVYGPNSSCDRRGLWEELAGLISWWNLPWCIGGDFDVSRFLSERLGEAHLCPAMVEFSDFIFDLGLMAIPLVGGNFTWSNNRDLPSWSSIDKFLVSLDWEAHLPDMSSK